MTIIESLEKARAELSAGKPAEAEAICRELVFDTEHAAPAQHLLGIAILQSGGSVDEAISWLESARTLDADTAAIHASLAQAYLRKLRFGDALKAGRQAVRMEGSTPQWRVVLAEVFKALGQLGEARAQLRVALNLDADNMQAIALLGEVHSASGDFAGAEEMLSRLPLPSGEISNPRIYTLVRQLVDARHNRTLDTPRRVLALRHARVVPDGYQPLIDWLKANFPAYAKLFELRILPITIDTPERYGVVHPWLQDPVQAWSKQTYDQAVRIGRAQRAAGSRIINPVENLVNASKSRAPEAIEGAGLRMPRSLLVTDPDSFRQDAGGLAFPVMIREDWGHGGQPLRIDSSEDLAYAPLEVFRRPVASEVIDVQSDDGNYRKYRYIACGRWGVSHHLMVTPHWITRGGDRLATDEAKSEELAYINAVDPNAERFNAARDALELEYVSFDYAYDRDGEVLVWEANPFAFLHFPKPSGSSAYRMAAIHRTMAGLLAMYLDALDLEIPEPIRTLLDVGTAASNKLASEMINPRGAQSQ